MSQQMTHCSGFPRTFSLTSVMDLLSQNENCHGRAVLRSKRGLGACGMRLTKGFSRSSSSSSLLSQSLVSYLEVQKSPPVVELWIRRMKIEVNHEERTLCSECAELCADNE